MKLNWKNTIGKIFGIIFFAAALIIGKAALDILLASPPLIFAGIPSNASGEKEFHEKLDKSYPVGSLEKNLIEDLTRQGFKDSSERASHFNPPCDKARVLTAGPCGRVDPFRITRVDVAWCTGWGRITWIRGDFYTREDVDCI